MQIKWFFSFKCYYAFLKTNKIISLKQYTIKQLDLLPQTWCHNVRKHRDIFRNICLAWKKALRSLSPTVNVKSKKITDSQHNK